MTDTLAGAFIDTATRTRRPVPGQVANPNGMGRPTTFKLEYNDRCIELGQQGYSVAEIARDFDVPRTTLQKWAETRPDFANALARAMDASLAWWEEQARKGLNSREFNAALWKHSVAGRFRAIYGNHVVQEHVGKGGEALSSPIEIARRLAYLLDAAERLPGANATLIGQSKVGQDGSVSGDNASSDGAE